MKNKQTERKSRSGFGLTRHLIGGVLCLAVISLICSSASAQNLFAVDVQGPIYGNIDEFTPTECEAPLLPDWIAREGLDLMRRAICFLWFADDGIIDRFTPNGVRSTFAVGLSGPRFGLAFDSAGNLFVADRFDGHIYKNAAPECEPTLRLVLLSIPNGLALFDWAGNLFVAAGDGVSIEGKIYKFTPGGARTTFASGLFYYPFALAFDSKGQSVCGGSRRRDRHIPLPRRRRL